MEQTSENKPLMAGKAILGQLAPISKLSPGRLDELAEVAIVERVSKDLDPTRMSEQGMEALYLIKGDLGIRYDNGKKLVLRGGSPAAKHPIDSERLRIKDTIAITPIEVMRIDLDLLDIMLTWDQISGYVSPSVQHVKDDAQESGASIDGENFNAFKLKNGVFSKVPAANIEALLKRLTSMNVEAGQTIITQGQEGDYYYLIHEGTAVVSRVLEVSEPPVELAEISVGEAFGEEALASDTKRNATVKMKTDGQLLRLKKEDFIELLKTPVVNSVSMEQAKEHVKNGAVWMDVRFESEFKYHHIEGAINAPIHELRNKIDWLDQDKEYIVYCQTGRRSSAAAFILAQFGIHAVVLEGGTRKT
ncbi:MAG: cyclic nucleotide-binding protein [Methylophilaceae bacterium]|nr:MAG: cyclic nucleotide-binding protein [Methylophilaceae bacterium]